MSNRSPGHDAAVGSAMGRIARGGTASLAGAGVSAASNFVSVLLVTRLFSAVDAGSLFASVSVFLILLAVVELGVDQGFVRFIAWYRARAEDADVPAVLRAGYVPVLVAALAATGIGLWVAPVLAAVVVGGDASAQVTTMLRVLACALPVAAIYELTLSATQGYGTMRPTVLIERLLRPALQPVGIVIAATLGAGGAGLAAAWVVPYLVGLLAAVPALVRVRRSREAAVVRSRRHQEVPAPRPLWTVAVEFWRFTAPRGLARVCQVALQRFDVVVVAALRGPRDAAVYTAVTRFIVIGQTAVHAVQQVLQPKLAELLAVDDVDVATTVFKRVTAWFVALTWPMYLVFAVYAGLLSSVFGPGYDAGAAGLVILSIGMLGATAAGPVDVLLLMAGRSGLSLINTAVALVVDVVLALLLVPAHGVIGAATARTTAVLIRNVLSMVQVHRHLRITAGSPALLRVVVASLVLLGAVPLAVSLAWPGLAESIVTVSVCTAAYLAVLWRWRVLLGMSAFAALLRRRSGRGRADNPTDQPLQREGAP